MFFAWPVKFCSLLQVHQLTSVKSNLERLDILHYWHKEGGVVIISYDIFRRLSADRLPRMKKKDKERVAKYLLDPGNYMPFLYLSDGDINQIGAKASKKF